MGNEKMIQCLNDRGYDVIPIRDLIQQTNLRLLLLREEGCFILKIRAKSPRDDGEIRHAMAYIGSKSTLYDNTPGQQPVQVRENEDRVPMRVEKPKKAKNGSRNEAQAKAFERAKEKAQEILKKALPKRTIVHPQLHRLFEVRKRSASTTASKSSSLASKSP